MFEPLNDLERDMIAASERPEQKPVFLRRLLQSELFYSPQGNPPGDGKLGPIASATTADDPEPAAALFTARERVTEALGPQAKIASMSGLELLLKLRGRSVRLNPNLFYFAHWKPDDVEAVLSLAPMKFK
jgi:hypothetical protein